MRADRISGPRSRRGTTRGALLAVAMAALHSPPSVAAPAPDVTIAELDGAFERIDKMSSSRRKKLLKRCLAAAEASGAPQVELVREWAKELKGKIKRLDGPTPFDAHDARVYKGGPPRRVIGSGRNLWDDLDAQLERRPPEPRSGVARPASYEYSTGELVQPWKRRGVRKPNQPPDAPFRALVAGVLPDQSIAEEALIRALDGEEPLRKEAHYFAHLYCDREANAYEGISLHDFWSTGQELEVPDPDVRAYAELIWDDDSVPLPLTEAEHDLWYPRIEESLVELRAYVFTTRALAATWFEGRPHLSHGYSNSVDIMNAAIALCEGDPERMAAVLAEHRGDFLLEIKGEIDGRGNAVWNAGNQRRDDHADGKEAIREAVLAVFEEEGLLSG